MEPIQMSILGALALAIAFFAFAITFVRVWIDCWVDKKVNPARWHYRVYAFSRGWIPNKRKVEDACTYMRHILGWAPALAFFLGSPKKKPIAGMGLYVSIFILTTAAASINSIAAVYMLGIVGLELLIWWFLKLKTSETARDTTLNVAYAACWIAFFGIIAYLVIAVAKPMVEDGNPIPTVVASFALMFLIDAVIIAAAILAFVIVVKIAMGTKRALMPVWQAVAQIEHRTICPMLALPGTKQQTN